MNSDDPDYVGYGHPPRRTRFGEPEGNAIRRGPRKRPKSVQEAARRALRRTVALVRDGKRERVTKLEAFFERLVEDAIAGQPTARRLLIMYLKSDPGLAQPEEILRIIDETMTPKEAAEAYAATLRAIPGMSEPTFELDYGRSPLDDIDDEPA